MAPGEAIAIDTAGDAVVDCSMPEFVRVPPSAKFNVRDSLDITVVLVSTCTLPEVMFTLPPSNLRVVLEDPESANSIAELLAADNEITPPAVDIVAVVPDGARTKRKPLELIFTFAAVVTLMPPPEFSSKVGLEIDN
jgi:hypothetical protein